MKGLSIVMLAQMITIAEGKATAKPGCKVNSCSYFLENFLRTKGIEVLTGSNRETFKDIMVIERSLSKYLLIYSNR